MTRFQPPGDAADARPVRHIINLGCGSVLPLDPGCLSCDARMAQRRSAGPLRAACLEELACAHQICAAQNVVPAGAGLDPCGSAVRSVRSDACRQRRPAVGAGGTIVVTDAVNGSGACPEDHAGCPADKTRRKGYAVTSQAKRLTRLPPRPMCRRLESCSTVCRDIDRSRHPLRCSGHGSMSRVPLKPPLSRPTLLRNPLLNPRPLSMVGPRIRLRNRRPSELPRALLPSDPSLIRRHR
jgi:hypothetical protein